MMVDVGAQLRKGVVEYCVLGQLAREPMYGWQLSETLVSHNIIASIGTLYPILSRLRARGLVSSFDTQSDSGPVRKYYRLTDEGTTQLEAFRQQWGPFVVSVQDLIAPHPPDHDFAPHDPAPHDPEQDGDHD
jgi:PadR family transcriptional regulator PadR